MKKLKRIMVVLPIVLLFLTACGSTSTETTSTAPKETAGTASQQPTTNDSQKKPSINLRDLTFKAGTYIGIADGKSGPIKVEVVFSEKKIESITVKEEKETPGIKEPPINEIPPQIIEKQSLEIDTISGATVTSEAILASVTDAVEQASGRKPVRSAADSAEKPTIDLKGLTFKAGTYTGTAEGKGGPLKVEVVFSEKKIDAISVKEHNETPEISDPAINEMPGQIVEKQSLDVDVISGASITSEAIKAAVADAAIQASGQKQSTTTNLKELSFKAGTYTGTAEGKGGPLKVEVVFSDKKIDAITVKEHTETPGISDPAINDIPVQIVEKQSLDVDVISGATVTSEAIKAAVADAVKQASGQK